MTRRRPSDPPTLQTIYEDLRSDFRMAKDTRFTSRMVGVQPMGSGADWHYRVENQFFHMIERARHFQRNDCIVGQGVRRVVANIVQDGFTLDVQTGDEALDADLKARFEDWAGDPDQCHSEGEFTWQQMQRMTMSHLIVDGDLIALPLRSGALQMVEAHRMRTPRNTRRNVVHGVLMDDNAKRLEYWLTKENLDPNQSIAKVSEIQPYPARDKQGIRQVFHIYNPERFSQRRGFSALAPCSDTVGMHDDLQFATLVKAQTAALIAILHERGPDWSPGGDQQKGDRSTEADGGYTRQIEGISAGLEVFGDKDEKLNMSSANVPSPEFFPHAMMILTLIAINLDLPVQVLLLDPSRTNFSSWRGAIDQARIRFKQLQGMLVGTLHSPVYRWKVRQWIASDPILTKAALRSDVHIKNHRWNPPAFRYIQPMEDAGSDLLQQRNGLNSPRRIQAARGQDWDDIYVEIVQDNGKAIRAALQEAREINADFAEAGIHWREVISLPTPDGVQIALSGTDSSEGNPKATTTAGSKPTNRLNGHAPALIGGRN